MCIRDSLCPGQLAVQRLFQPGNAAAFCIQIADQMLAQRNFCAAPCLSLIHISALKFRASEQRSLLHM